MLDMTLPVYDIASPSISDDAEVYTISVVDFPAIESDFIALSDNTKVKQVVFKAHPDKQMLYGAVLIPDKLIYRNDADGEYYIRWNEQVIEQFQQQFAESEYNNKINYQHKKGKFIDAFVSESWIVADADKDKSTAIGLSVPKGTWCVGVKIKSEKFWKYYIKQGKLKGFSVEAFVNTIRVQKPYLSEQKVAEMAADVVTKSIVTPNKSIKSTFNMFLNTVKELFQKVTSKKVSLSVIPLKDGSEWNLDDATYEVVDSEGNVPADGEYILADDSILVIENGVATKLVIPLSANPEVETEDMSKAKKKNKAGVKQSDSNPTKEDVTEVKTPEVVVEQAKQEDATNKELLDVVKELYQELQTVKSTLSKLSLTEDVKLGKTQKTEETKTNAVNSAINSFLKRKQ